MRSNIKHMHALRIMEFAAAIALVLAPKKAKAYLSELGVDLGGLHVGDADGDIGSDERQDIVEDEAARARLKQELGLGP